MTWDELFILQAVLIAQKSKDTSTKVGCVIVSQDNTILSTGFNGFPRGIVEKISMPSWDESNSRMDEIWDENQKAAENISARWQRPEKYFWVEHAERNAIYNAARNGIKILGAKAYLNWEPKPCADCTRALIQAGIVEIIGPNRKFSGAGAGKHYSINHAEVMLQEAGVATRLVNIESELL